MKTAGIGIALSAAAAVSLDGVVIPLIIPACATVIAGIWFYFVVKRFS